jgi:hypothetical protein
MALNNTTADAVATAICAALNVVDAPSIAAWKDIMRQIYAGIKADAVVSVASVSGVTTGGGTSGPGTGTLT